MPLYHVLNELEVCVGEWVLILRDHLVDVEVEVAGEEAKGPNGVAAVEVNLHQLHE